jgi:uncharacterized protein (TIGR02145 family)
MALLNYAEGIEPFIKSIQGNTFQSGQFGFSIKNKSLQRHPNSGWQKFSSAILTYCAQAWRSLSATDKANWQNWVEFLPQSQLRNPALYLTAYHNFVKRNFYFILKNFPDLSFMLAPELVAYNSESISIVPFSSVDLLELELTFTLNDGNQDVILFISPVQSSGKKNVTSSTRLMYCVPNSDQTIDISSMYFAKFGRLPVTGDNVFCEVIFCGIDNGQFSIPIKSVLTAVTPPPPIFYPKYGLLYNFHTILDARNIAASGWHVPTQTEFNTLDTYLGGSSIAGGKLKETGFTYWDSPNSSATNEFYFNGRGAGMRIAGAGYLQLKRSLRLLTSTPNGNLGFIFYYCLFNSAISNLSGTSERTSGMSIRLVKDSTSLSPGQSGTYTGNDGKIYRTICIGTQEWLADDLSETEYRNNDSIPEVTNETSWAALTSGALCAFNNDWNNV